MKNFLLFSLTFLLIVVTLYAGLDGLTKAHSYGTFFTFVGAITTIGLGLDVINHLRLRVRRASVRKLRGL